MKKPTVTYPLRLPASLKAAVAEISKEDGTSINQFVTAAVAEKISAMKTAEFFTSQRAAFCEGKVDSHQNPKTVCRERRFTYLQILKEPTSA